MAEPAAGAADERRWTPGSHILLREVWRGRIWTVRPVTVVADGPDLIALYLAPGTPCKHPRGLDGTPLRLPWPAWQLVDDIWPWSTLRLHTPGSAHEVWPASRRVCGFDQWYVNLQEPLRRTELGFDYMDQALDVVISSDLSTWQWKDEDELAEAVQRGLIAPEQARAIRVEGERVVQRAMARAGLFAEEPDWRHWMPPEEWLVPVPPRGWELV